MQTYDGLHLWSDLVTTLYQYVKTEMALEPTVMEARLVLQAKELSGLGFDMVNRQPLLLHIHTISFMLHRINATASTLYHLHYRAFTSHISSFVR